jgi:hypothetical protein
VFEDFVEAAMEGSLDGNYAARAPVTVVQRRKLRTDELATDLGNIATARRLTEHRISRKVAIPTGLLSAAAAEESPPVKEHDAGILPDFICAIPQGAE